MPMLFIHQCTCISPQQTFPVADLAVWHQPVNNKLVTIEPAYDGIPKGALRRMSKPVRIGIGAGLPLLNDEQKPDGIIIGTANAGMEDCFYFLQQIIDYKEGLLTPGNFVQSTPNALAAQLGMLSHNKGYNATHVHLGLAFENALIDAMMLLEENPGNSYLVGAVDDISTYNYNINLLDGWFKDAGYTAGNFYDTASTGSIPGEAAAMFTVNTHHENAVAKLTAIETMHSTDSELVTLALEDFIAKNLPAGEHIDVLISGENGDNRLMHYYENCETLMNNDAGILRFKHMSGEYPTATAMALWLGCYILEQKPIPGHMIKKSPASLNTKHILIYNTFKGAQHSFMLLSAI
ncbi:hypothetical protein BH11BAC3_BH11BAC3_14320 [soil metagenome]